MRVWIDDEHPIFRRGLGACLQSHRYDVVGESSDFAPVPPAEKLDALVFEADGHRLGRAVRHVNGSGTSLVALVAQADEQTLYDAVDAGVAAILVRPDLVPSSLISALSAIEAGNTMLPAGAIPKVLERAANGTGPHPRSLAARELAVLGLLAGGNDTKGIAEALCYSERTVKNIVHDVLMKMNCRNRAHAVAVATRRGMI